MGAVPTKEAIIDAIEKGNYLINEVKNIKTIYVKKSFKDKLNYLKKIQKKNFDEKNISLNKDYINKCISTINLAYNLFITEKTLKEKGYLEN